MLERGFEYFPSPESSDDDEIIAYQFLYCASAVDEWPRFRRELEETGAKSPEQCDHIEKNAIEVFREVRDTILTAIDTNNLALMSQSRLLDHMVHAHAFMAIHADPASLFEYRRQISPQIDALPPAHRPQPGDFCKAVWEGKWNLPGDRMPAEVTREETFRSWWLHEKDGLYNTGGRLDPVATAGELDPMFPATEPMTPLDALPLAFLREKLRALGRSAGLSKAHADFLPRMALDGARQDDNPSAWRAIRDRKRAPLLAKVQELLSSLR